MLATLTAPRMDLDAAGLLLVAEVEQYLRSIGVRPDQAFSRVREEGTGGPARLDYRLSRNTACPYGQVVQPWHAAITLPQPSVLDRIRGRRPVAEVTVRQHLDLVSRYIHQYGWLQGALWDQTGRVCLLGAQLRVLQAGYGTPATVQRARLRIGNELGHLSQPMPVDTWNDLPGTRRTDVHQLLQRAAARAHH